MIRFRSSVLVSVLSLAAVAAADSRSRVIASPRYATADAVAAGRSDAYREGQRALESGEWESASRIFAGLAASKGDEVDAALYWKAYADWKGQRKKEALDGLRRLVASYPDSAWVDDAKALDLEIRGAGGATPPDDLEDEDLKLYALDGLMQVEPEKAVPVLERLLAGDSSPRIKERALFVLSQSGSPRAREVLLRVATTGQPVEMRLEAIRTLGMAGDVEGIAAVARDKGASAEVREAVIEAYLISNRTEELAGIVRSDPDPRMRRKAIEALGANGQKSALQQLLATEKDPELRLQVVESLGVAGDVAFLAKTARESGDPDLRRKAIEGLGVSGGPEPTRALRELYAQPSSPEDKRKVLEALMVQGASKTLIELFRSEKDPAMKRAILQQLTVMDDPEITRVILEALGEKP